MEKRILPLWLFIWAMASIGPASAQVSTATLGAAKDTTIFSDATNNNLGIQPAFYVGVDPIYGGLRRGLVSFNLASLPPDAAIQSVDLALTVNGVSIAIGAPATATISLAGLNLNWTQGLGFDSLASAIGGTQGVSAISAGGATWDKPNFFAPLTWAGGSFGSIVASASVSGVGTYHWSNSAMVAEVQSWLDNPASNFGWAVIGNEANNAAEKQFASLEGGVGVQPLLTITYTVPVPEPEAYAMLLAGLGLLGFAARRRKLKLAA